MTASFCKDMFMVANITIAKNTKRSPGTRASSSFIIPDTFDDYLAKAAEQQIAEVESQRTRQLALDQLVLVAIKAANAAASNLGLTTKELADAVNGMLQQLVEQGVLTGTLPSSDRIRSLVNRYVANRGNEEGRRGA